MHSHCANGHEVVRGTTVLILVVMEDALAPMNLLDTSLENVVLILVVMEDALARI